MKRIKITAGVSVFLLVVTAMLLTHGVMVIFWAGDLLTRETGSLRTMFTLSTKLQGMTEEQYVRSVIPAMQSAVTSVPGSCFFYGDPKGLPSQAANACIGQMSSWVEQAMQPAMPQLSRGHLWESFATGYCHVAVPVTWPEGVTRVMAAGLPFSFLMDSLWRKEKVMLLYLLFNAVVLSILAFFRFLKVYVFPLDRMIRSAETYQEGRFDLLFREQSANELGILAHSLQSMVEKIETDKAKLSLAVRELAEKNTLLQENQQQMLRAEKMATVGRMGAGLAHEIGNPLSVVHGYLQLLHMEDCPDQERRDYAGRGLAELNRVDTLIRTLLDYARTAPGASARFDVHDLITEVIEALTVQPLLRQLRVQRECRACTHHVHADSNQVRQVLVNCLFNAVDAVRAKVEQGDGLIVVATDDALLHRDHSDHRAVRITIKDNGTGIPAELLETVFEPFFTTKEPGAGTGLGLSVSRSLVHSFGGEMELRSTVGMGTTVSILLPSVEGQVE